MNDYQCHGCNGLIMVGQHVVLRTTVVSVEHQRLGEATLYHAGCFAPEEVERLKAEVERLRMGSNPYAW